MATTKLAIESVLNGTIVMENKKALWNTWLCSTDGTAFLNEISKQHDIYCSVDSRKQQLIVYGVSEELKVDIERQLHRKISELPLNSHNIFMPNNIPNRGTLHSIRERFGESVTFFLREDPKRILLRGTIDDVKVAKGLLREGPPGNHIIGDTVCMSCYGTLEKPLTTTCGHSYCQDCFEHMASSSTENLPLHCIGIKEDGEACSHVFPIAELQKILPLANFEKL